MDVQNQKVDIPETVISIRLDDENGKTEKSRIGVEEENSDGKNQELAKGGGFSTVIDVQCDGKLEDLEERVCRICHLSTYEEGGKNLVDLIELGCGCKGELGFVHSHCAEAWFKLKGNRMCEICGAIAQNVTGISDNRFIEEWNDGRSTASGTGPTETNQETICTNSLFRWNLKCWLLAIVVETFSVVVETMATWLKVLAIGKKSLHSLPLQ